MADKKNIMENEECGLSEKEVLIFNAVIELVNEGQDLTKLKVGDITAKAGIGKGTAYEYFSSKEEIVEKALKYSMATYIRDVMILVEKEETFRDKFFCLLNYMQDHKDRARMVLWILKLKGQTMDFTSADYMAAKEEEAQDTLQYLKMLGNWFLSFGDREGLFKEQNENFRISALLSQVVQFGMYLHYGKEDDMEAVKEFVYDGLIKQLN